MLQTTVWSAGADQAMSGRHKATATDSMQHSRELTLHKESDFSNRRSGGANISTYVLQQVTILSNQQGRFIVCPLQQRIHVCLLAWYERGHILREISDTCRHFLRLARTLGCHPALHAIANPIIRSGQNRQNFLRPAIAKSTITKQLQLGQHTNMKARARMEKGTKVTYMRGSETIV